MESLVRRYHRERADALEDRAMSNEINRGQAVEGQMPRSTLPYRIVDTPYERYLHRLRRLGDGLPVIELPDEAKRRKKAENRKLANMLLK